MVPQNKKVKERVIIPLAEWMERVDRDNLLEVKRTTLAWAICEVISRDYMTKMVHVKLPKGHPWPSEEIHLKFHFVVRYT